MLNPASRTTNKSVFVHAYIKVINYRIINQRTNVRRIKFKGNEKDYFDSSNRYLCDFWS